MGDRLFRDTGPCCNLHVANVRRQITVRVSANACKCCRPANECKTKERLRQTKANIRILYGSFVHEMLNVMRYAIQH